MQRPPQTAVSLEALPRAKPGPGERDWVPAFVGAFPPTPGLGVLDRGFGGSLSPFKGARGPSDSGQGKLGKGGSPSGRPLPDFAVNSRFQICSSKRPQAHCAACALIST